jgi:hypothetical protein
MLARQLNQNSRDNQNAHNHVSRYASDRVFDGVRPLSADRAAKLRANYQRTHTTLAFRFVARARRVLGLITARC